MLNPEKTSLLCPRNDLESDTILKLAETLHLDVHPIEGQWGLTLEKAFEQLPDLGALREHVIIVEMPDKTPDKRRHAQLRALGKVVHEVDHHAYNGEKPLSVLSSLEQFAQLMNYKLSDEHMKIAINDRDYLMGLSKIGVPWAEAESLRKQEWRIRGQAEAMCEARSFVREYARDFEGNVRLILSPEEYSGVMLEAAQFPTKEEYEEALKDKRAIVLKTVLVLHYREVNNTKHIYQVEFAGPAKFRDALTELSKATQWQTDFDLWQGGGESGCFFGANEKHGFASMDALISDLLDICLYAGRPLRHYGCTFYLPLDLFLDSDLARDTHLKLLQYDPQRVAAYQVNLEEAIEDIDKPIAQERQAYLYFLPHIRDLAFHSLQNKNKTTEAIKHWKLKDVADFKLDLNVTDSFMLSANITDISLYGYFNELYMLAISVIADYSVDETSLKRDDVTWWHDLVFSESAVFAKIQSLQMQYWLYFTHQARIIYPSFVEQIQEGKLPKLTLRTPTASVKFNAAEQTVSKESSEISPIVLHLVKLFFTDEHLKARLRFVPDDRMFVAVAYGLSGLPPETEQGKAEVQRLFSLALYVDHHGSTYDALQGYAYDPTFTRQLLAQHSSKRWEQLGTYMGACAYANAHLGFGWFFNHVIAPSHVPFIYGRMLLLALFYQITLRHFNRRVSYATEALSKHGQTTPFRELRKTFILFTNGYWFRDVTSQTQGIEIFELQTKGLGLEKEYSLIKDEMERADEYSLSLRTQQFNHAAFIFALVTLLVTVLTVDAVGNPEAIPDGILRTLSAPLKEIKENYGLLISVAILPLAWLWWRFRKNK